MVNLTDPSRQAAGHVYEEYLDNQSGGGETHVNCGQQHPTG